MTTDFAFAAPGTCAPVALAPDGSTVESVTISNGGARALLTTWGATLVDFRLAGVAHPLVLGARRLADYLGPMRYFGAIVGRVANRIAGGRAQLVGRVIDLERNENGVTTLHGGSDGCSGANWRIDGCDVASCRMALQMPDGQAGFPGALDVAADFRLDDDGALTIQLEGRTSAPTFCSLAHHSYWNLDGAPDVATHRLQVFAERFLPVDAAKIPLGPRAPVAGGRFDFRAVRAIIEPGDAPLDHTFCLRDAPGAMAPACVLAGASGVTLTVSTTEPGLHVYDGSGISTAPSPGLRGAAYGPHAGLALEPQRWPDAPHHPDYPSILLLPDQVYRQTSCFHVRRAAADGSRA